MKLWVARDKSGDLYLYENRPKRRENTFDSSTGWAQWTFPSNFSEVTWENSPVEVEFNLAEEIIDAVESPSKTFSRVNDFEVGASYRR